MELFKEVAREKGEEGVPSDADEITAKLKALVGFGKVVDED